MTFAEVIAGGCLSAAHLARVHQMSHSVHNVRHQLQALSGAKVRDGKVMKRRDTVVVQPCLPRRSNRIVPVPVETIAGKLAVR